MVTGNGNQGVHLIYGLQIIQQSSLQYIIMKLSMTSNTVSEKESNIHVLEQIRTVEGWLTNNEALLLFQIAKHLQSEGQIVEIGSWKGKSTIVLALGHMQSGKRGYVWSVDPHQGSITLGKKHQGNTFKEFETNILDAHVQNYVKAIVSTSANAANRWKKPIRLLFIDGLHDYQHVAADIAYWSSWVVTDGVIVFHDAFCGEKGVWDAVRLHILTRKDIVDIGTVSSILFVVLGKKTLKSRLRIVFKTILLYIANYLHNLRVPWILKLIIIHRIIRVLLVTAFTKKVYAT